MNSHHSALPTPRSWLITGGAGFIGRNLIKHLLAEGMPHIRILDDLSVGTRDDLKRVCRFVEVNIKEIAGTNSLSFTADPPLVQLVVGDIRDSAICLHAARNIDTIVHLAANTGVAQSVENPRLDMEINVIGTLNMLEAARKNSAQRFIFASSGAPIGECEPPIHEELAPHPVSPYGASKLAGEGYCSSYFRAFGVETVCLRFGNVYGPLSSHKSSVVAKFIRQALADEVCEIYGDGNQTRDFIYVDDLVYAIIKATTVASPKYDSSAGESDSAAGQVFQIATNKEHTVNEVVDILRRQLQARAGCTMLTRNMNPRIGDVRRNFSDTSKALRLLNWQAKIQLEQGISSTLDWFLEEIRRPNQGSRVKAATLPF